MSVDYWDCEPYDYDPYDYIDYPYDYDDIGKNYRNCKTVIESIDGIRYRYDHVNNVACVIGIDCDIKEIFIPEKVKSLKNNEWYTVNSIGTSSFARKSVFTIKFPNTIKEIGESAFRDCKNLKNIEIPKEVKEITNGSFENCISLEKVILGEKVKRIDKEAFQNCKKLIYILFPQSLEDIGECVFSGCGLKEIVLDGHVKVAKKAFYRCESLQKLYINCSEVEIGKEAFEGCNRLTNINVPDKYVLYDYSFLELNKLPRREKRKLRKTEVGSELKKNINIEKYGVPKLYLLIPKYIYGGIRNFGLFFLYVIAGIIGLAICAIGCLVVGSICSFVQYILAGIGLLFLLLLPVGGAIIGIYCVLDSTELSNKEKVFFIIGIILLAGYIFYLDLSGVLNWLGENYVCEL